MVYETSNELFGLDNTVNVYLINTVVKLMLL